MPETLYRATNPRTGVCAGWVEFGDKVVACAPIFRRFAGPGMASRLRFLGYTVGEVGAEVSKALV